MLIRRLISIFLINSILVYILYSYLYYSQVGEFPVYSNDWIRSIYLLICANIIGFSIVVINSLLNKVSFWRRKIGLRFILGIVINYFIILLFIILFVWTYLQIENLNFTISALLEEYHEVKIRVYILVLVLDILFVVFDFLVYSYKYYSQGQIQNAKLARKQMELQFEALRTQLSPHYLFNSLNTISSLIYKDINQTEQYIRKLASTYQYILASDRKQIISLDQEIEFIKDYCYLLNIRFGEALQVNFDVENHFIDYNLPPISIQILVENAVKHNVFDDENPLEVDIYTHENKLVVKNKILKTPASRESFKIGLSNIQKRYQVFTDKDIRIIKNDFFTVELPLLKPKTND